jgi:hypothetical protein
VGEIGMDLNQVLADLEGEDKNKWTSLIQTELKTTPLSCKFCERPLLGNYPTKGAIKFGVLVGFFFR